MSDLERAAAEEARRRRERAEEQARLKLEAEARDRRDAEALRAAAVEFFAFACDHGAPTLPIYDHIVRHGQRFTRTSEQCIVAQVGFPQQMPWAVTEEGRILSPVTVFDGGTVPGGRGKGINDKWFVVDHSMSGHGVSKDAFVKAAGALLESVPLTDCDFARSGVQAGGLIVYPWS